MDLQMKGMEIKVKLKKWELNFAKQTGCAPTKVDIEKDETAKNLYIQYSRLKKLRQDSTETKSTDENKMREKSVWGEKLLKSNTSSSSFDTPVEGPLKAKEKTLNNTTISYNTCRDNIRKNVCSKTIRSLPTSFKHSSRKSSVPQNLNVSVPQNSNSENSNKRKSLMSDVTLSEQPHAFSQSSSNCIIRTPSRKPLMVRQDTSEKKIKTKTIDVTWLNNQMEDLTDLLQVGQKNEIKDPVSCKSAEKSNAKEVLSGLTENIENSISDTSIPSLTEELSVFIHQDRAIVESAATDEDALRKTKKTSESTNDAEKQTTSPYHDSEKPNPSSTFPVKCTFSAGSGGSKKSANTNYIRLNMKQKCFGKRGKGRFLRKQVFREKLNKKGYSYRSGWKGRSGGAKSEFRDKSEDKCFKCGESGHWASKCKNKPNFRNADKKKIQAENEEPTEFLMDVVESAQSQMENAEFNFDDAPSQHVTLQSATPLYNEANYNREEVKTVLKKFGYTDFRKGQEEAIKRILCGQPTLLVLSTGSGKSLCYQLPAHLYSVKQQSLTLVVSPLVSLMDDQVHGLPKFLKATRLHSGMSKDQREKVMKEIQENKVDVLLVSPEALMKWAGMPPHYSPLSHLPPISFVCIDECHCLAEWSHSFRPSYLRVCQILKEQLGVKCLVGLTATATMASCHSVAKQLGIENKEAGMIVKMDLPSNLTLSVSRDAYKDESLEQLLMGERFGSLDSIIIYCTRRDDVSRVSSFLRTKLQTRPTPMPVEAQSSEATEEKQNSKKRKKGTSSKGSKRRAVTYEADCYHAGMSSAERRRVQNRFMSGKLRIVVATVAFGMGIDKHDVRAVIHYNMPRSFERYVQEVGRAGRDGLPAHCHLFLDPHGGDIFELARHTYGKTVDRHIVKKLLKSVFPPCDCERFGRKCSGHFASIPIDSSVDDLDVSKEGIETLLCYLELDGLLNVYLPTEATCSLRCYGGPAQLIKVAKKCAAVAAAISKMGSVEKSCADITFSMSDVANAMRCDLSTLKKNLRQLVWDSSLSTEGNAIGKSGVVVEFQDVSFLIKTKQSTDDEFIDKLTSSLHQRVAKQEKKELFQLRTAFNTMQKFSFANIGYCMDEADLDKSNGLKEVINKYFQADEQIVDVPPITIDPDVENDVRGIIRQFLTVHSADLEGRVTGRAIARILHGIDSPRYPARTWGPARRFWRSKMHVDFNSIIKIATEEILKFR
uniref:DNA 3'-5' helicase n=1 Tax=Phallusia mammillata TaxID=59560 RepID=A0A6F9DPZ6_9ASCI|nr:ATP-dependent DNA helicase Q4 [Phallusia mammillata]